ncbi:MAG: phospholipase D-like domain-containing protein [Patescibacteria group bacterium]|jgi:cardiolipin synthase
MKYRLYTTSQKAWDGMLAAISQAKKSIYLEMYSLQKDTQSTHDFLGILKEKAQAGIEVVIIADSFGSFLIRGTVANELRKAGIELIFFSHWLKRTHRKILIVDNHLAFFGGVNIKEKSRDWLDLQMRVEGRIILPLLQSFAYSYTLIGGKNPRILKYNKLSLVKKVSAWVTDTFAGNTKTYNLNAYYRYQLMNAKRSIKIVTPYLLPPRRLLAALDQARLQGVDIQIIIPNNTDVYSLNRINYLNACRLSSLGIKFYLIPHMNHAKMIIVDDEEALVGSQNMDILSFRFNMEVGVFFKHKKLVADLVKIFDRWKDESINFNSTYRKINLLDRFLIRILKIFYPIL